MANLSPVSGRLLYACVCVLTCIVLHPYGFLDAEDAAVYFGYYNNDQAPAFPYYYAGYFALMPQLAAALAHYLPLAGQPPIYILCAVVCGIYFAYELVTFLDIYLRRPIVSFLAATLIALVIIKTNSSFNFFMNLAYSIWPAWLGIMLRVMNAAHGRKAFAGEVAIGLLAALSHPFCMVLVPLMAFLAITTQATRDARPYREYGLYGLAATVYFLFGVDHQFQYGGTIALSEFIAKSRDFLTVNRSAYALAAFSVLPFLAATGLVASIRWMRALLRHVPATRLTLDVLGLSYIGGITLCAYLFSPRYVALTTFEPRYLIPAVLCAVLIATISVSRRFEVRPKSRTVSAHASQQMPWYAKGYGVVGILLVALTGVAFAKGRQTPEKGFSAIIEGERFLVEAEVFRASCQDGALARRWDKWSLTILCHKTDLARDNEPMPIAAQPVFIEGSSVPQTSEGKPRLMVPALYSAPHDAPSIRLP